MNRSTIIKDLTLGSELSVLFEKITTAFIDNGNTDVGDE